MQVRCIGAIGRCKFKNPQNSFRDDLSAANFISNRRTEINLVRQFSGPMLAINSSSKFRFSSAIASLLHSSNVPQCRCSCRSRSLPGNRDFLQNGLG
ncbi:hypothetical protein SJA_C1-05630 [Sphingobium indicum UT26S]|uniref:Uncharacterized protein n=1 Tax=Sphingobium indicum (strain DSM 16413 / CCM 7287 / MTCC 6362 / UT26 / NBRC 101211 / UT26S) TaxID=452662 RepID=D4YYG5_SPHIU|nr:hypothetical protein SJA_C1-05630 [Sphingobium indicum UT26S]